jgi:hypothetical protein
MSDARPGHGAILAVELSPLTPGVFTAIAELLEVKHPDLTRPETETTPHNEGIDSYQLGVLNRSPLTATVNFIYNNNTHDHLTGLYSMIRDNLRRGWRLRGPEGSAGTDEWIMSGQVQNVSRTTPARSGQITADVTIRMSGAMILSGTVFS